MLSIVKLKELLTETLTVFKALRTCSHGHLWGWVWCSGGGLVIFFAVPYLPDILKRLSLPGQGAWVPEADLKLPMHLSHLQCTVHVREAPESHMHRNINSSTLESVRGGPGTATKSPSLSFLITVFLKK